MDAPRLTALVALLVLMGGLAGCLDTGQDAQDDVDDGDGAPSTTTVTSNVTHEGTVPAPNPAVFNPVTQEKQYDGEEGVHYVAHPLTVNTTTTNVALSLAWEAQAQGGVAVPDLDLIVVDADGNEIMDLRAATSAQPEAVETKVPAGQYEVRVYNFAGVNVAYALTVTLTDELPRT